MAKVRNYRNEYERRIANAAKRGLSKSQARGHARAGETPIKPKPEKRDAKLEAALKLLRKTGNRARAAKEAGVAPERFAKFLRDNSLAHGRGKSLRITDNRPDEMLIISDGDWQWTWVSSADQKSVIGEYMNAVQKFNNSNDIEFLATFVGRSVTDMHGIKHPLETDPNVLLILAHAGGETFDNIYRRT